MAAKIFISGHSGTEKSHFIRRLLDRLEGSVRGYYTTEVLEGEKRAGFSLNIINGESKIFAHVNMSGAHRVGKYGVDLKLFEEMVLTEIQQALKEGCLLILDEIGKMELHSIRFKRSVLKALTSENILVATVMNKSHPFIDQLRGYGAIKWLELTEDNEEEIMLELLRQLQVSAGHDQ